MSEYKETLRGVAERALDRYENPSGDTSQADLSYWQGLAMAMASDLRAVLRREDKTDPASRIVELIDNAADVQRHGGGEGADGALVPGHVDFAELERNILAIIDEMKAK